MTVPLHKSWTQEEFLAWVETQELRNEFDGLRPVAMTGGTNEQGIIVHNLQLALGTRLRGKRCRAFPPDSGLATIGSRVRYPDGLITCSPQDPKARLVTDVVVVFEVISPSTAHTDRITKVREYAAVASIRRYVMIESTTVGLTVYERGSPNEVWRASILTAEEVLHIVEVGIEIPVAELYEGLVLGEGEPDMAAG
jgi:Uma2 family endonuclease